ncbi:hypothetical protein [Thermoflavimicrobium daqui]|nr:hypothetical protein [Thermoflavimicrobium daqui]
MLSDQQKVAVYGRNQSYTTIEHRVLNLTSEVGELANDRTSKPTLVGKKN